MKPAIEVQGLSKQFRLGTRGGSYRTLRESVTGGLSRLRRAFRRPVSNRSDRGEDAFWAIKDVSFAVRPGEVVGLLGRNGAGKSTALKIISRIVEPTFGQAVIRGRIGSLLEVGTGFHPELTGRENIYLNGAILGMSRREINRKFTEIVAFSEVEKFLDTPVKRYSSGMYVRLAFAVAAHLEPEILVVDEVLAVGDQQFQQKCLGKMKDIGRDGRTILFVSHNLPAIQNLCSRAILLSGGRVAADGDVGDVIQVYNRQGVGIGGTDVDLADHPGRTTSSIPTMRRVRVVDDTDGQTPFVLTHGTARLELDFEAERLLDDVMFGVVVKDRYHIPIFGNNTQVCPTQPFIHPIRRGRVTCRLPDLPLMPGTYSLDLYFGSRGQNFDIVFDAAQLVVQPADVFGSGRLPPQNCGSLCWPLEFAISDRA